MRKFTFLILFFFSFLCLGATLPVKTSSIQGKVTDSETNQPISNARIVLFSLLGKPKASTLTDVNGQYGFKKLVFSRNGSYCILRAAKTGNLPKSIRRFFNNGKTYNINFNLTPKVSNQPPTITSITPADDTTFLSGAAIKIQISASDPENDSLEYQFSIGGTITQGWSILNNYTWQTSDSDTGAISITCEVRDSKGASTSKTISCSIINPTVEEILQKVADNFSKIYDFSADAVFSSTLNDQPFGDTEYCRYYFMAPYKEKIEVYTDASRSVKNEVIITSSGIMFLIDPVNKISQEVDLLSEANISSTQFHQMDLYYRQADFLNNHTVTNNDTKTDFNNFVVCLDAIPKSSNNLYSKLELYIDFNKGLLIKSCLYKEDENSQMKLLQVIEAVETEQMSNGAWLPKKMRKTPVLKSGNLIEVVTYSNLQINSGLTDSDFDPQKQY